MNYLFNFKRPTIYIGLIITIVLLAVPQFLDKYYLNLLISCIFAAYLAQSWNIMSGYAGQFSFGHAAFLGLGAYTSALLFSKVNLTPWLGMLIGGGVAVLLGLIIGILCFRYHLKGHYFALATLAFAEIFRVFFQNWRFAGGANGVLVPIGENPFKYQFADPVYFYYIILLLLVILTFFISRLSRSKLGLYLTSIRENEEAAEALGVGSFKYKLIAVAISSFFTALGGTFYVQYFSYIDPGVVFDARVSVNILSPAIIGGVGTVLGPVVGAFILTPLSELTSSLFVNYRGLNQMIYSVLLIIVIIFLPNGLMGLLQTLRARKDSKKAGLLESNIPNTASNEEVL